jgi:hypothetical protein
MAATPAMLRTILPTLDLEDNVTPKNIVAESPQEFRIVPYPATSFSQSNAVWNIIPPSPTTIISVCSRSYAIAVQYHWPDQEFCRFWDAFVINSQFAGLCQYPLHQMIATLTITLNNQAITIRPSQLFDKFGHYNFDRETQKSTMSSTPCYPDQAVHYDMLTGRITSEFALYGSSVDHISRQHTALLTFTSNPLLSSPNASGTAQFFAEFTEPLMINPLIFDREWWRKPGIAQITNFTVNMTFDPVGIQRVWRQSINDYVNYTNIQVTILQPILYLAYYTLPTYMTIPPSLSYPYTAVQNFVYNFSQSYNSLQSFTLTSNTIQFQSIPHRLYISVSKAYNTKSINDSDTFLPITGINITWGNVSGVLSTLSQYDLWLLCEKNGLKQSWPMFSGQILKFFAKALDTGNSYETHVQGPSTLICLEFGSDIQLLNEDYPGKQGTWNFQIQVNAFNSTYNAVTPQLDIIVIYHGTMTIAGGSVTLQTGLVTPGAPIPGLAKTTFPRETDFYSGGKFDLGIILNSIPGRIFRGLSGLVSGLLSPEEGEHPAFKKIRSAVRSVPSISRQITVLPQAEEEEERIHVSHMCA